MKIYLLFKGWDGPDCSPCFHSAYREKYDALDAAKELQKEETKRHLDSYPNGYYTWHKDKTFDHLYFNEYSIMRFDISDNTERESKDEVIYIQETELL